MDDEVAKDEVNSSEIDENVEEPVPQSHWFRDLHVTSPTTGWMQKNNNSLAVYVERELDTLVVSFDNLQDAGNRKISRGTWGYSFFTKFGYSHLGISTSRGNWFRDQTTIDLLENLKEQGFFDKFKNVAFTGTSMGGFAALAFSQIVPNSNVVVFSPQTSLDTKKVPWETRFRVGRSADWSLPYSDGTQGLEAAKNVYIVYDPIFSLDRKQIQRIPKLPNVHELWLPGCGHKTAVVLRRLDALNYVQKNGIEGKIDAEMFRNMARRRRYIVMYKKGMLQRLEQRQDSEIGKTFGNAFLHRRRKHMRWLKRQAAK